MPADLMAAYQVLTLEDLKDITRLFRQQARLTPDESKTLERLEQVQESMQAAWDSWQSRRQSPGQEPDRRVRVLREDVLSRPARLGRSLLAADDYKARHYVMTRRAHSIGFVDGRVLEQSEAPPVELEDTILSARDDDGG